MDTDDEVKIPTVPDLMEDHGLNERQAQFVMELVRNGGHRSKAYGDVYDYDPTLPATRVKGSQALSNPNVKQAYHAVLCATTAQFGDIVEDVKLTKQKLINDLEAAKVAAFQRLDTVNNPGSMLNSVVRAVELQGKEIGMFASRHRHEHEHSLVPPEELLRRLARSKPELAAQMASHIGVRIIDSECSESDI